MWVCPVQEGLMALFVFSMETVCLRSFGECDFPSFTLSSKSLLAALTLAL